MKLRSWRGSEEARPIFRLCGLQGPLHRGWKMLYSKVSLPRVSSRHQRGPVRLPEAKGDLFRFKKEPRHYCCLALSPLHPHTATCLPPQWREGSHSSLSLCNLAQTHRKSWAKVCYMKVWIDGWSKGAPFKSICQKHTLTIHSILQCGDWAKRLKGVAMNAFLEANTNPSELGQSRHLRALPEVS